MVEVILVGGVVPPQSKTRVCCCRESMETSRITTTGHTWMGKSRTTLYGSVVGAGSLISQQASTPRHLERYGVASQKSWPRKGGGYLVGVGTPRDPLSSPTSFLKIRWASAGPKRSRPVSPGGWTSGRGVSLQAW